jgi:RNA polymerase sigma-70 factor (ECF subfamily)
MNMGAADASTDQVHETTPTTDQAFAEFYAAHHADVARAIGITIGDAQLGHDAADEAMARTYQRWSKISRYDNPAGWTYRVGLNWSRSWLRRNRRHDNRLYRPDLEHATPADVDLERAIAELSDDHRAVVVCRYLLDWSVEATADALHLREGTVKSRLSRALTELERHLGDTVERSR